MENKKWTDEKLLELSDDQLQKIYYSREIDYKTYIRILKGNR